MFISWASFQAFFYMVWWHFSLISSITLVPCQDMNPSSMCTKKQRETDASFRNQCSKNWRFARFQCCASCAISLGIGHKGPHGSVVFTDQEAARKLLLPKKPCQDEGRIDGTSYTLWCKNMIKKMNESVAVVCSNNRAMQKHCLKTCNFEECQEDTQTAPKDDLPKPTIMSDKAMPSETLDIPLWHI